MKSWGNELQTRPTQVQGLTGVVCIQGLEFREQFSDVFL